MNEVSFELPSQALRGSAWLALRLGLAGAQAPIVTTFPRPWAWMADDIVSTFNNRETYSNNHGEMGFLCPRAKGRGRPPLLQEGEAESHLPGDPRFGKDKWNMTGTSQSLVGDAGPPTSPVFEGGGTVTRVITTTTLSQQQLQQHLSSLSHTPGLVPYEGRSDYCCLQKCRQSPYQG